MKGDFTRLTFRPENRYDGVRLQQGRVGLDADWNEQVDIDAYQRATALRDVVGPTGAPHHSPDEFRHFQIRVDGADVIVAPGRIYVDGILCENDAEVRGTAQPHLPEDAPIVRRPDGTIDPLPATAGTYLVYLDVWRRDVTPIEDPKIREVALGGPDTAIRTQTVWQVGLLQVAEPAPTCLSEIAAWDDLVRGGTGRLRARSQPGETSEDPCIVPPGGGYRRLENQLYRVEIHDPGPVGTATFKWSRENGSIVTRWQGLDGPNLIVESAGRDETLGFAAGDWVELTDDDRELRGEPGLMVRLANVEDRVLTVAADTPPFVFADFPQNPKVRRWNLPEAGLATVERPPDDGYLPLEDGVEVRFEAPSANGGPPEFYRTGDYWLIPARTLTADVEWRQEGNQPAAEAPHGIRHHFCRLAVVEAVEGGELTLLSDCRPLFPPLTELTSFFYAGGDGQEARPGADAVRELRQPLQVGVANGQWPVPGARVRFEVTDGEGVILPLVVGHEQEAIVLTDAAGVAACGWRLDNASERQQVTATLLDDLGRARHLPIRFSARLSVAGDVGYAPGEACPDLVGITTVQEAIDELCKTGNNVEGIHVSDVLLVEPDESLRNDSDVPAPRLATGLHVECDGLVDKAIENKPVCSVTIDLPFPFNAADRERWGEAIIGFQPIVLAAEVVADETRIVWTPIEPTREWLLNVLFNRLLEEGFSGKILARLTLKGNVIWSAEREALYLDGDTFGIRSGEGIGLDLPSGDRRRGGDFEMWFWLVPERPGLQSLIVTPSGGVTGGQPLTGTVTLSSRAPAGGGTVQLTSNNPAVTVPEQVVVEAGKFSVDYPITTQAVATDQNVTITARLQGSSDVSVTFQIRAPILESLTLAATTTGAATVSGTVTLNGRAPTGGIDVALRSNNQQVATVPATVRVQANQFSANFTVTTQAPGQTAIVGNLVVSRAVTLSVLPNLAALTLNAAATVRGKTLGGTVTLTPAVPFPVTVTLASNNPAVASVPASIVIGAGSTSGSLTVNAPGPLGLATITASLPGRTSRTDTVRVQPRISSLTVAPTAVNGGSSASGTVRLESAPPFAVVVSLSSTNPSVANPPNSVGIAAGSTSSTFSPISTVSVAQTTTVNIRATYNDVPQPPVAGESLSTASLTVRPVKSKEKEKEFKEKETKEFVKEFEPKIAKEKDQDVIRSRPAEPVPGPIPFAGAAPEETGPTEPAVGRAFIREEERPPVSPPVPPAEEAEPAEPPAAAEPTPAPPPEERPQRARSRRAAGTPVPPAAPAPEEPAPPTRARRRAAAPPEPAAEPVADDRRETEGEQPGDRRRRRSPRRGG